MPRLVIGDSEENPYSHFQPVEMTNTETNSRIYLSFFPVEGGDFKIRYFWKDADEAPLVAGHWRRNISIDNQIRSRDITLDKIPGYNCREQAAAEDPSLTKWYLYNLLVRRCKESLHVDEYRIHSMRNFIKQIDFVLQRYEEGIQVVTLSPYILEITNQVGFLADFAFRKNPQCEFNRRIQQLSLALDSQGRSNKDFYLDKAVQMSRFKRLFWDKINLLLDNPEIALAEQLPLLETSVLKPRTYVFGSDQEANNQYAGIKQFGPHRHISEEVYFFFIFRAEDRPFAVDLLKALRGEQYDRIFPGMETFFKVRFDNIAVGGQELADINLQSLDDVFEILTSHPKSESLFPIIIAPSNERLYYTLKHHLLDQGISSQYVTTDLLRKPGSLKWSAANIGLQIFAKLGGKPWTVKTTDNSALIVGIGQAHHLVLDHDGTRRIERYIAYSLLLDSSGNYIDLQVIADNTDSAGYYSGIRKSLLELLRNYAGKFTSVVVHTPFKLQKAEMQAIGDVVERVSREQSDTSFYVLKINDHNRFFGYDSRSNSRIPAENTWLRLSKTQFLAWFEGLSMETPNVNRRISGPIHIEIAYPYSEVSEEEQLQLLQDLANLAGANWRGFNGKSTPISVQYCQRVSRYAEKFSSLGLGPVNISSLKPWFL